MRDASAAQCVVHRPAGQHHSGVCCTFRFLSPSSWGKHRKTKPQWRIPTRQRNRRPQRFLRGNFVCSSFHGLGAEVGRKDRAHGWRLCHIPFRLQPSGYSFFGCTAVIAPGVPFLQKGQLQHPADDSEDSWGWARTYIAFPFGAFCLECCCLHISLQLPGK